MKWAAREKGRVRGTCRECGFSRSGLRWRPIRLAREASTDPFEALAAYLRTTEYYRHCDVIFDGKIVDVRRETARGFAIGHVVMEGVGGYRGKMEVTFQNENLVARLDGRTRAIVPDLVCICDSETAEPITTDGLRYGQRVRVMAVRAPPGPRAPRARQLVRAPSLWPRTGGRGGGGEGGVRGGADA